MKILDFIKTIPFIMRAKNPDQLAYLLNKAYSDDLLEKTNVFDRDTDRFYLIKTWGVKNPIGWLGKRYILKILDIMNKTHKPELLTSKDKVKLDKQVKAVDRSVFSRSVMSGSEARSNEWNI